MLLDPAAPFALAGSATVANPLLPVLEAIVVVDEAPALLLVVTWTKTFVLGTGEAWRLRITFTTTLLPVVWTMILQLPLQLLDHRK